MMNFKPSLYCFELLRFTPYLSGVVVAGHDNLSRSDLSHLTKLVFGWEGFVLNPLL